MIGLGTSIRVVLRRTLAQMRAAEAALRDFLRGFTGIPDARPLGAPTPEAPRDTRDACAHDPGGGHAAATRREPSPADVRRALTERAARRPSCC